MEIRLGVYPVSPVDRLKLIRDTELKVGKFLGPCIYSAFKKVIWFIFKEAMNVLLFS